MTRGICTIANDRGRLNISIWVVGKQHLRVRGAVIGGMGLKQGDNGRDSLNIHQGVEGTFLNSRLSNHKRIQQYTVIIRNSQIKANRILSPFSMKLLVISISIINSSIQRVGQQHLRVMAVIVGMGLRQGNSGRDCLNSSIRRLAKLQSGAVIGGSSCRQGNTCTSEPRVMQEIFEVNYPK